MSLHLRMPFKSFEYSEIEFNNYSLYIYEDEDCSEKIFGISTNEKA